MLGNERFSKTHLLIVLALAEGILTAVLAVHFLFPKPYTMSWGDEIDRRENYLYLDGKTLTQEDLEAIASIKTLRSLSLTNCNVAECNLPKIRFDAKVLDEVDLSGTKGLWDLSFLSSLPAPNLSLAGCENVSSIAALNWEVLTDLDISNTAVSDLSPAAHSKLRRFYFANTEVSDLTPLTTAEDLYEVDGSNSKVTSLDTLANMKAVSYVTFDGCAITELPTGLEFRYLNKVSLRNTKIADFSPLANVGRLYALNLAENPQIDDLTWLAQCDYSHLEELNVAGTSLSADDLGWLQECPEMERLTLNGIELGNLDLCSNMPELRHLSALGCGITDVSGIRRCKKLQTILLGYNKVENLANLPMSDEDWRSPILDLSHNGLTSLDGLPAGHYRLLMVHGNKLAFTKRMLSGVEAYDVVVSWGEGIDQSPLTDSERFSDIYLLDCPPSEFGTVDRAFYRYQLTRVSNDELLYLLQSDQLSYGMYDDLREYVAFAEAQGDGSAEAGEQVVEETEE